MELYLASHIHMAVREEDLLVLDADAGEYLCLPSLGQAVRPVPGSNVLALEDGDLAAAFVELGLTEPQGLRQQRRACPKPPSGDLMGLASAPVTRAQITRMTAASVDMALGYWKRSFPELLARTPGRARGRTGPFVDLAKEVAAFHTMLPWVPFQGQCLFRALMLRAFLRRAGLDATWVVGCQTWPFEAHCWLQVEGVVLDDTADHVAGFTPLLAV